MLCNITEEHKFHFHVVAEVLNHKNNLRDTILQPTTVVTSED